MKRSFKSGTGYLVIDHSASPGLSARDVAHVPHAVAVPEGTVHEADALGCAHCQQAILLQPGRVSPKGWCAKCAAYLCESPLCNTICAPFAKQLDDAEVAARTLVGQPVHPDAPLVGSSSRILLTDQ
jgi:hypothetical protein